MSAFTDPQCRPSLTRQVTPHSLGMSLPTHSSRLSSPTRHAHSSLPPHAAIPSLQSLIRSHLHPHAHPSPYRAPRDGSIFVRQSVPFLLSPCSLLPCLSKSPFHMPPLALPLPSLLSALQRHSTSPFLLPPRPSLTIHPRQSLLFLPPDGTPSVSRWSPHHLQTAIRYSSPAISTHQRLA